MCANPQTAEPPAAAVDRTGAPRPLLAHLGMATAAYAAASVSALSARDARFPWSPELRAKAEPLATIFETAGAEAASMAVLRAAAARMGEMIAGIEAYQAHPHRRALTDPPEIWRRGSARLLDYGAAPEAAPQSGPAVLVIPSLINRAYVLDLAPNRSLMRWLAARGLRPLLLDWGEPRDEELDFNLSAYARGRLFPALDAASAAAGAPVAVLGYCMGGALVVALAQRRPDQISHLATVGAPWNFAGHRGAAGAMRILGAQMGETRVFETLDALGMAFGAIPVDFMQMLFAALDPNLAARKFRTFARMPRDSAAAREFVAIEDWLNDGMVLSHRVAREILVNWCLRNETRRGVWMLDGETVRPERIAAPTLIAASPSDRIAPPDCADPLAALIPGARRIAPGSGHVGMVVGRRAEALLWRPLAAFMLG